MNVLVRSLACCTLHMQEIAGLVLPYMPSLELHVLHTVHKPLFVPLSIPVWTYVGIINSWAHPLSKGLTPKSELWTPNTVVTLCEHQARGRSPDGCWHL